MKSSNQTKRINLRLFLLAALVGGLLALSGTHTARAAGIVVNSAADVVADDGQCTLREAIIAANSDTASGATAGECAAGSGSDTITFADDYVITLDGSQLPVVTSVITIIGNGPANTIIQANAAPNTATYRVLQVSTAGSLTLDSVTVRHGRCLTCGGGGIYNLGTVTVTNSTLSGNYASHGGGIASWNYPLTVTNSTISGNNASIYGGGIYSNSPTMTVTNSTLSGNYAGNNGGGIASFHRTSTVINSTLSGNNTTFSGGGIYNQGGTLTVTNSTLSGNNANSGGGIGSLYHDISGGTVNLANSLIIGSTGGNCYKVGAVTLTADASNIASDASCGGATVKTAAEIALGPLANNGGPTLTMALGSGSAAINAGNNSYATAAGLTTDQRGTGFARISGGTVDVGAFEVQQLSCEAGSYDNGTECVPADPGHYVPGAGATDQTPCAPGSYQPNSGATNCNLASPGYYVDVTAAVAQIACAPGSYQPANGATSCLVADAGHFVDTTAAVAQTACSPGFYQPNSGQTSCLAAPLGTYVPTAGAISASFCSAGTFSDVEAAVSCQLAQPGHYVDSQGAAGQTACSPGYYQPNFGATSCLAADPGFYVPGSAATEQLACPAGYTSDAAATACTLVEEGYTFTGFFAPVDMAALNGVKAGQAIPVKFSLGGDFGLDIMAAGYPASTTIACDNSAPTGTIEETVSAGSSSLSYDADSDQYIYVWKTNKGWANSCRVLTIMLDDGSVHQASFKVNR
jgi:CSLREA domain-containing protein